MNRRRLALAALILPIALNAMGCEPPDQQCGTGASRVSGQTEMQEWHFQDVADPLGGFTATQGNARSITTLTEGELGLELSPGAVLQQTLNLTLPTQGPNYLGMIARCDQDTSLRIEVVASVVTQQPVARAADGGAPSDGGVGDAGGPGGGTIATPTIHVLSGTIAPGDRWNSQTIVLASSPMRDLLRSTGVLVSVQISLIGPGRCSIDEVELGALDNVNTCR